jgi:hypothetical protein
MPLPNADRSSRHGNPSPTISRRRNGIRTQSSACSSTGDAYAVPAFGSEWYPREMYVQGSPEFKHHVATYGPQSQFGYKEFFQSFKAEKFDATAWAKLFKEAGVKYVVPVAEHHDGFPMYDSELTDWTAKNSARSATSSPRRPKLFAKRASSSAHRHIALSIGSSSTTACISTPTCATRASPIFTVQPSTNAPPKPKPSRRPRNSSTTGCCARARSWTSIARKFSTSIGGFASRCFSRI